MSMLPDVTTAKTYDEAIGILAEDHAGRVIYGYRGGKTPSGVSDVAARFGVAEPFVTAGYQTAARRNFPDMAAA